MDIATAKVAPPNILTRYALENSVLESKAIYR